MHNNNNNNERNRTDELCSFDCMLTIIYIKYYNYSAAVMHMSISNIVKYLNMHNNNNNNNDGNT